MNPGEKAPYQLLAAARFLDKASHPRFSNEWIPINDDLTSIIGGKSSGKSLFLYCLAASANREEADTKASVADAAIYRDIVGQETFDFEIKWGNGDVASLKKQEQQRPITYVPQLYINHLSEEQGREHLNALIRTILLQNRELATVWADTETDIESINGEVTALISQLFSLRKSYRDCSDTIKALGSKEAVTDRRNQLVSQIDDLRKQSGFTGAEERRYQALTRRIASLTSRKERLTAIVSAAEDVRKVARQKLDLYTHSVRVGLSQANVANDSLFVATALDSLDGAIFAALEGWEHEIASRLVGVPTHINKIAAALEERGHELIPLQAKVTNRAYLDGLIKALDSENQKLKEIEEKERQQQLFRKQGEETSASLLSKYALLHSKYLGLAEDTERRNSQLGGGITVAARVALERERFQTFFNSFDARGGFQKLFGEDAVDENGEYIFENGRHVERICHLFDAAKSKEGVSRIRRSVTEEDVVRRLMSDCFSVTFVITYKGDDILVMSPGKRGLVILSLILHLSDAKHPILVDQPEDNLDNRTIYEELCQFIRDKKVERQIITVTHNANLVVATDSDCVIVANQSGQQVDRDNRAYQFEYVGGALEDTFVDPSAPGVLFKSGIREQVCEILEGGRDAFIERERKYGFS